MTFAAVVGPLVAYAAAFQTLVFLVLPARLRTIWAPMTIGTAGAGLTVGAGIVFGFDKIGLGLGESSTTAAWAVATFLIVASAATLMLRIPRLRSGLADPRIAGWSNRHAFTQIAFRIPVMTALIEEAFFRGVLHAALLAVYPESVAVGLGAALFGIWHIGPALDQAEAAGDTDFSRSLQVAGTVVATTVAGLGLVWLRIETGSIWAPFAVHAVLNMTMALFARIAAKTTWLQRSGA